MSNNDQTKQRINDLVDAALHHLQADGTVDRGGLAEVLRALRDITNQCPDDIDIVDPMTRCLGFVFDMKEVKSWPTWLCDYSVVQEAIDNGWIVEIRKEPFIPRLGQSFIISGLSDEGRAEFIRRIPVLVPDGKLTQWPKGGMTTEETERLLGSGPSRPAKLSDFFSQRTRTISAISFHKELALPTFVHNPHKETDQCGFDRTASHNEDTYVCECGWRAAPKTIYKS